MRAWTPWTRSAARLLTWRGNRHAQLADDLDAQLPTELRANASAPGLSVLTWPDEPRVQLQWPQDFAPLPADAKWDGANSDALFDDAFYAAMAAKLAPVFASPTAALRSWMWAMHHQWSLRAAEAHAAGQSPPGMGAGDTLRQWLMGAAAVRHAFATQRERKYTHASIGHPPEPPAPMALLGVTSKGASCTIDTLAWSNLPLPGGVPSIATRGDYMRAMREAQVHAFVLKRKDGQWRVDRWKKRPFALAQRWSPQYL